MPVISALIEGYKRTKITRFVKSSATGTTKEQLKPYTFQLDALTSERFRSDSEITSFPIEGGSVIGDHIIEKQGMLTLVGEVSATPIDLGASLAGAVSSGTQFLGQKALGQIGGLGGGILGGLAGKTLAKKLGLASDDRLVTFVDELQAAKDNKLPVQIQTGLRTYPSRKGYTYLLKSFDVNRNEPKEKIEVTLEFVEVRTVSSKIVRVTFPKTLNGAGKSNLSQQAAKEMEAKKAEQASILYKGGQAVGAIKGAP